MPNLKSSRAEPYQVPLIQPLKQCSRNLTSKDLRNGNDSIKLSYILLFLALFFTMILRNVTLSCKHKEKKRVY